METTQTAHAPKITRHTLRSFAHCVGCDRRHGHAVVEVVTRTYYGIKCHRSSRLEGGPARAEKCECGKSLKWVAIKGTKTDHVCDSRCTHAKGGDCQCSCGGANHGQG